MARELHIEYQNNIEQKVTCKQQATVAAVALGLNVHGHVWSRNKQAKLLIQKHNYHLSITIQNTYLYRET